VNVAGLELTSTPLSIPSRTNNVGGIPGLRLPGSELGAFLSLVTGFVEKIPAMAPSQVASAAPNKDNGKNSTGGLHDLDGLGNSKNLSKGTKHNEGTEAVALPSPVAPVQEPAALIASLPIVYEVPRPGPLSRVEGDQVTSSGNKSDRGSAQLPDTGPMALSPAIPAVTALGADVAFALRLTPDVSEPKDASKAVISSSQPVVVASVKSGLLADQQFKSEPSMAAAPGSTASATRQPEAPKTNGTLSVRARISPRPISPGESGTSQPEPKDSKAEPAAKRDLPISPLNSRHAGGNATSAEAPTRPPDTPGTAVTRVDRSSSAELQALKVASEPEIKVGIAPPPFRQISLKLSTDDSTRVNLDLIEKSGKVQVTVRTPDHELAKSLQTDLGDLIGRLESRGFKTESWIPAAVHQAAVSAQSTNSNGGFGQPQQSGAGQGGGQQHHQRNGSNQRQQARWTAQIQETLSANEARSES
jgi:hypothetical protein